MACMKDCFFEGVLLDGRFQTIRPLNHGSFGMVFLANDITTGEQVAIKCITKYSNASPVSTPYLNDHLVELTCHARLGQHSNVVNLIHAFETDTHMYLVLEFCSMGDLYEAIRLNRGPLETEHVRDFMFQLVNAVEFMHSKGLYHRDIKPENIFLTQDGAMKLGDFGLSTTETWTYESSVGSDRYMAPEQYDAAENGYSPAQADIWAIGICLLNILFSRNPFVTPCESDLLFSDFVRDRQSLFDVFPSMSQDTFEVLMHCLALDPQARSLTALRESLRRVVTFTTDDDVFDEFCTDDKQIAPASANRQPLRTPSIQSPPVEQNGAFPWAKALHMSSQHPSRQLSAIQDIDDGDELFPGDKTSVPLYYDEVKTPSLASVIDSAIGASLKSMTLRAPKPRNQLKANNAPISGSLPATTSQPVHAMSMVFGNKDNMVSKSWSDIWDEEEEEEEDARRRYNTRNFSTDTLDEEDLTIVPTNVSEAKDVGQSTKRNIPAPISVGIYGESSDESLNSSASLEKKSSKSPIYYPPFKVSSLMDKWAALGNRRRAYNSDADGKPAGDNRKSTSTGRRGIGNRGSGNKGSSFGVGSAFGGGSWWGGGKDKEHEHRMDIPGGFGGVKIMNWRRDSHPVQSYYNGGDRKSELDQEWVGGWQDFHL